MTMRLKKAVASVLALERVCRVATAGRTGVPHVVPVCQVLAGGKVYFASAKDARKVANLRENPGVALVVDIYAEDWAHLKGAMVQGRAKLIGPGPQFRKIRRLLYAKYPQYPVQAALDESDTVMVEVTPMHVFTWEID